MLNDIPQVILGTKQAITDSISVSIRLDRTLVVELGKNVVLIFSADETLELLDYLQRHVLKFVSKGGKS